MLAIVCVCVGKCVAPTRYDRQLYYHLLHRMEYLMKNSNLDNINQIEMQSKYANSLIDLFIISIIISLFPKYWKMPFSAMCCCCLLV